MNHFGVCQAYVERAYSRYFGLLRARRDWPCDGCAAKHSDELAPPHIRPPGSEQSMVAAAIGALKGLGHEGGERMAKNDVWI